MDFLHINSSPKMLQSFTVAFERSPCNGDYYGGDWHCCAVAFVGDSGALLERQHHTRERHGESQR
jgi:hypothetical protein